MAEDFGHNQADEKKAIGGEKERKDEVDVGEGVDGFLIRVSGAGQTAEVAPSFGACNKVPRTLSLGKADYH